MDHPQAKIRAAVWMVLELLANQDYEGLSRLTGDGTDHLEPADIARSVDGYPGSIRMPTARELTYDVIEIVGRNPREYSVDIPVFTAEEGRSDLTARITVIDRPGEDLEVAFYDVWVM